MVRGRLTRLGHWLGVILMILQLAHVPLPFPEHRSAAPACQDRPGAACSARPCPVADAGLEWHWFATTPGAVSDDDDEIEVAAAPADESDDEDDSVLCPHLVAPHRARLHHFVR